MAIYIGSTRWPNFYAGLPTLNYEHAQHPDEAHDIIGQARAAGPVSFRHQAQSEGGVMTTPTRSPGHPVRSSHIYFACLTWLVPEFSTDYGDPLNAVAAAGLIEYLIVYPSVRPRVYASTGRDRMGPIVILPAR